MNTAERILELERQLKVERQYSARLRFDIERREARLNELAPGWYVVWAEDWEGPFTNRAEALRHGAEYAGEHAALTVRVEERFGAAEEPATPEEEDAYNGVTRGVDYPVTLARGVTHVAA